MLTGFRLLTKLKGLRGTAFDVFGKTAERKMERALIVQYQASMNEVLQLLSADNTAVALELARLPEHIKGFGHVKERNMQAAQAKWAALTAQLHNPVAAQKAA
jgi:indolepyruvate ferredoxin oxidoreductase